MIHFESHVWKMLFGGLRELMIRALRIAELKSSREGLC